jgi:cation diffusion facilitator family transporter
MDQANRDKSQVALNSVFAAVFLTAIKLVVGGLSGSLGIMAEAAHSGLDLVAALVTLLAVRASGKPADRQHLYGHGKIENLSALFETLLLLVTCVWIIHEAYDRLLAKTVVVDASIWTFLVMGVSIGVDVSRSRMLYRAAKEHKSQALEADALHFSTDIWSSAVVLVGLLGVRIGEWVPALDFLAKADAVAALGVALIVIYVSGRLGSRTLSELLDAAPEGMSDTVKSVAESIPEVKDCHSIRLRSSGPRVFIDAHVTLDGNMRLSDAHRLTDAIEERIQAAIPGADITVHPEPERDVQALPTAQPPAQP